MTSSAVSTQTRQASKTKRQRKHLPAVYQADDGRILFVPTPGMWALHRNSGPVAVCRRASLPDHRWKNWKAKFDQKSPWLPGWLYHDPLPDGVRMYYRAWSKRRSKTPSDAFAPDEEMTSFRRESLPFAIVRAAKQSLAKEGRSRDGRGWGLTNWDDWLARLNEHEWFEGWLLRGQDPPPNVTVATEEQINRFRGALDYINILADIGLGYDTYIRWWRHKRIPSVAWLRWIFGWPGPEGVFVVTEKMMKFREHSASKSIFDAADLVNWRGFQRWNKDELLERCLEWAAEKAQGAGSKPDELNWPPEFDGVDPRVKRSIWKYALSSALVSRCGRVGIKRTTYYG